MKLKYLFLTAIAGAALVWGCGKEDDVPTLSEFKASKTMIGFSAEGGSEVISVNASADWSFDESVLNAEGNTWLTVSPTKGDASVRTVSFSAPKNETGKDRSLELKVTVAGKTQLFTVKQVAEAAAEAPISTIAEVSAGTDGVSYRIKGTVTGIANTNYGNLYMADETGTIYIYGLVNSSGQYPKDATGGWAGFGIESGDIITVQGPRTLYNGTTLELVDASLIAVEKSLIDVGALEFEILPAEAGSFEMTVNAKVSPILLTPSASWIKVTDVAADEEGASIYTVEYEANPELADRTAAIEIKGPGAFKSVEVKQQAREATEEDILAVTIAEFNAKEVSASRLWRLTGVVTGVRNANYGNFYIKDFSGETYVYGLDGFSGLGIDAGDIVTLYGQRGQYNETIEVIGAVYESHIDVTEISIADFLTKDDDKNTYYRVTGTVTQIANETYGNLYITDGENTLYIYGCYPGYGAAGDDRKGFLAEAGIKVGDELTMIGYKDTYNGTIELCGGIYFSHEAGEAPENPQPPEAEDYTSSLTWTLGDSAYDDGLATVNGTAEVKTLKFGTSKKYGEAALTVPAGKSKVTFYAVAWKGAPATLKLTAGETEKTVSAAANDGASGNAPYTMTVSASDKYTVDFGSAFETDTEVKIATADGGEGRNGFRAIVFAINAE